jgi:hypothetical protein
LTTAHDIETQVDQWVGERPEAIEEVLDALATAVRETAEHLRTNWQDRATAKQWDKVAGIIDRCRASVNRNKPV